jgi:putative oxidoreductase
MREWGPTFLRVIIGVVFIAHGAQKLFGVWGGGGLVATADFLATLGVPAPVVFALGIGLIEAGGGLLLAAGAYTLWAAVALVADMAAAIWKVHFANGFFLNWTLTPGVGHGYEYHLTLIGGLVCLILTGAGALSVDGMRVRVAEERAMARARLRAKVDR